MRLLTERIFIRYGNPVRQLCDFFDYLPLHPWEYIDFKNARGFREFVRELIHERRAQLADPV